MTISQWRTKERKKKSAKTFHGNTHTVNETSIEEDEIANLNAIPFNETYAPSSKDENAPSIIKLILMLVFIFLIALALILDYNDFFDTGQERQKSSIIQEGNLTDKNKTNDDISKMEKN